MAAVITLGIIVGGFGTFFLMEVIKNNRER